MNAETEIFTAGTALANAIRDAVDANGTAPEQQIRELDEHIRKNPVAYNGPGANFPASIRGIRAHIINTPAWARRENKYPDVIETAAAPSVTAIRKNPPCSCRCGASVNHPLSSYLPGHDARHAGDIARQIISRVRDGINDEDGMQILLNQLTSPLRRKALRMVDNHLRRAEKLAARKARKEADIVGEVIDGIVKIGRWDYPARTFANGHVFVAGRGVDITSHDTIWNMATDKVAATFRPGKFGA